MHFTNILPTYVAPPVASLWDYKNLPLEGTIRFVVACSAPTGVCACVCNLCFLRLCLLNSYQIFPLH